MDNYEIEFIGNSSTIDRKNENVDVYVIFQNGKRFTATFFTITNIITIMSRYKKSGECRFGSYFWASDMCIVEEISEEVISECINDMIESGEFEHIFSLCNQ